VPDAGRFDGEDRERRVGNLPLEARDTPAVPIRNRPIEAVSDLSNTQLAQARTMAEELVLDDEEHVILRDVETGQLCGSV
jgi:hypothetical protein